MPDSYTPEQLDAAFGGSAPSGTAGAPPLDQYDPLFESAGKQYNVDPKLLKAIAYTESRGDPDVVSGKKVSSTGAIGLMQFMPETAKSYGIDPTDPTQAIPAAAKYISTGMDKHGSVGGALLEYAGGPNQAIWGQKTLGYPGLIAQNYGKVSAPTSAAPTAPAAPSGAPQMPSRATGGLTPEQLDAAFGTPAKTDAPQPSAAASTAAPSAPATPAPDAPNVAFSALPARLNPNANHSADAQAGLARSEAANAGVVQGVEDIPRGLIKTENYVLPKLGIGHPVDLPFQQDTENRLAQYGNQPNFGVGRFVGNSAVTLPVLGGGAALLGRGAAAVGEAVPELQPAINFLSGGYQGGKLLTAASRATAGATGGAAATPLLAATSDDSLDDQFKRNVLLGGATNVAIPAIAAGARYVGNAGRSLAAPFTETGQNRLAQGVIDRFAGGPVAPNTAEIIPGSQPTMAEATGNAGVANLQRTMRDIDANPFVEREQQNAAARSNALLGATGTPQDIESAAIARDANASKNLGAVFAPENVKQADTAPVVGAIDSILSGPSGKRPAVVSTLNAVKSTLVNPDGSLERDPETLYNSVRKQIGDLMDTKDLSSAAGKQAASELLQVRSALDDAIEGGAPGFKNYLSGYSAESQPISSMKWLQGLNLTDQQGNITLNKVQNALKNYQKQSGASGVNGAKSLTEDQVNALQSIRDDLLRASNASLGRSAGSPTVQNIATQNMLSNMLPGKVGAFAGKMDPSAIGSALGGSLGGFLGGTSGGVIGGAEGAGLGAGIGGGAGRMFSGLMAAKNAEVQRRLQSLLLNPSAYDPALSSSPEGMNPLLLRLAPYAAPTAALGANRLSVQGQNR